MAAASSSLNIAALRDQARRRLPPAVFDYLDGGADDERSLRRNEDAFAQWRFVPRMLNGVPDPGTASTLFGQPVSMPLMLSPTGLTRLFHPQAEMAVAQAAADAGLVYALSTVGTTMIEDFVRPAGPKAFQTYVFRDRGLTLDLIERCKAAGVHALIVTVDTPVAGNRERDRRSGFSIPPRFTLKTWAGFVLRPAWSLPALFGPRFDFVNVTHRRGGDLGGGVSIFDYVNQQFDPTLDWDDIEWLAKHWGGPLAVKGVLAPEDALEAERRGASAVILSNHGGRQLDGTVAPVEQIEPVAQSVGGRLEIVCDGGIRRGSDILKAMALGATACAIGRPYLYGLAAGGRRGVTDCLSILRTELVRCLRLSGIDHIRQVRRDHIVPGPSPSAPSGV